jgi:hypothetical protein|uniref:Uncharacterized protein n=1 Tax=Siphoviridae sp. cteLh2 TaxID=2825590 RepID=A0A8S5U640_9CAUD|nr:hypothetical protein [uncultured Lachnoclostridium sp.]DAF89862.1 MAG TPA: hypothetical protein [Siphoviridae sp. cteLh2]
MIRSLCGKLWQYGVEEIEGLDSERLTLDKSTLKTGTTFKEINNGGKVFKYEKSTNQWYEM